MSVVVISLSLLLSMGAGVVPLRRAVWHRTRLECRRRRKRAALAAAAESGPYGHGEPAQQARTFARVNGARVIDCLCDRGATAMQVKVSVGAISAEARSVLDPSLLRPTSEAVDARGLDPQLATAVRRLVDASHGAVRLVSGYRSVVKQTALWECVYRLRYGSAAAETTG